jgi:hypothetical protein
MPSSRERPSPRVEQTDTFWSRLSPTARHGVCIGFLLLVSVSYFSPILFENKSIVSGDNTNWRAIANVVIEYEEKTGHRPLWTPNVFGGMPTYLVHYGERIPQLDTVVETLRPFVWPTAHLFLLLVGVYLLVFYLTRNHLSGLLSAIAFGFTTYLSIILGAGHNTKFIAMTYAPYVLLAFVHTLRRPSLLAGLLFSGALALNLRARHPQMSYYVLMLALFWWIVEAVYAWRNDEVEPFAQSTGWLAMGTGLALLMVAQPYFPIFQYKQFSVRGAEAAAAGNGGGGGGMGWQKAMGWSQGPKELFTLVVADAFGGGGGTYWGPKAFTEGPHYLGGAVAALSGIALWRVQSRVTWGLGVGVLFTTLFALGKHAAWINWPVFQYFPFFNAFRAPETWLSATVLGLAVLAGIGFDYCLRPGEDRAAETEKTNSILYVFGGLLALVLLLRLGPDLFFDFEKPNERQRLERAIQQQRPNLSIQSPRVQQFIRKQMQRQKEKRRAAFKADATRTLVVLGVVMLLLWLYRRGTFAPWLVGGLVALVVLVDLWGVDRRYLGDDDFQIGQTSESQIPTHAPDRFIKKQVQKTGGPGHFRVFPWQTPASRNPSSNAYSAYHYQSLGGYHAAKLQRYQDYLDHILGLSQRGRPNENALDLMNARYVVAQQRLPGTEVVFRDQQTNTLVLENTDAVPRGFFVGQTEVIDDPQSTWRRLRDSAFDPRTTAILPEQLDAPVTPIDSNSTADATLESHEPERIEWSIETDAPRLFVASEIYYPAGWTAYLDGEEVPIHRVDYLLRGVHVPAGEHTLVMKFEPKVHTYGLWTSGATTTLVYGAIGALLWRGYRRRREDHDASSSSDESDNE